MIVEFNVNGMPSPQGSKTAVTVGGKARVIDKNPKALKAWRNAVDAAARETGGHFGAHVPLLVQVVFRLPRGKTVTRKYPTTRPDLDKTLRATYDALTTSGLIHDDSQIVESSERKRYALDNEEPGARIRVSRIDEGN